MNEEALNHIYSLFQNDGYTKSLKDFNSLMSTNSEAFNRAYRLFVEDGYNKNKNDFEILIGIEKENKKVTVSSTIYEYAKERAETIKKSKETPIGERPIPLVDWRLLDKEDDEVVKTLSRLELGYGDLGFSFSYDDDWSDWIKVKAKNGNSIVIETDNWKDSQSKFEVAKLNSFIRENADYKGERYTEEILTQDVLTQGGGFFDPYTKREVGNAYYMGGLSYSENEIKDRAKRNGIDWDNYGAREAWFEENNIKSPFERKTTQDILEAVEDDTEIVIRREISTGGMFYGKGVTTTSLEGNALNPESVGYTVSAPGYGTFFVSPYMSDDEKKKIFSDLKYYVDKQTREGNRDKLLAVGNLLVSEQAEEQNMTKHLSRRQEYLIKHGTGFGDVDTIIAEEHEQAKNTLDYTNNSLKGTGYNVETRFSAIAKHGVEFVLYKDGEEVVMKNQKLGAPGTIQGVRDYLYNNLSDENVLDINKYNSKQAQLQIIDKVSERRKEISTDITTQDVYNKYLDNDYFWPSLKYDLEDGGLSGKSINELKAYITYGNIDAEPTLTDLLMETSGLNTPVKANRINTLNPNHDGYEEMLGFITDPDDRNTLRQILNKRLDGRKLEKELNVVRNQIITDKTSPFYVSLVEGKSASILSGLEYKEIFEQEKELEAIDAKTDLVVEEMKFHQDRVKLEIDGLLTYANNHNVNIDWKSDDISDGFNYSSTYIGDLSNREAENFLSKLSQAVDKAGNHKSDMAESFQAINDSYSEYNQKFSIVSESKRQLLLERDFGDLASQRFGAGVEQIFLSVPALFGSDAAESRIQEINNLRAFQENLTLAEATEAGKKMKWSLLFMAEQSPNLMLAMASQGVGTSLLGMSTKAASWTTAGIFGVNSAGLKNAELNQRINVGRDAKLELEELLKNKKNIDPEVYKQTKLNLQKVITMDDITSTEKFAAVAWTGIVEGGITGLSMGTLAQSRNWLKLLNPEKIGLQNILSYSGWKAFGNWSYQSIKGSVGEAFEETAIYTLTGVGDGLILGDDFDASQLTDIAIGSAMMGGGSNTTSVGFSTIMNHSARIELRNSILGKIKRIEKIQSDLGELDINDFKNKRDFDNHEKRLKTTIGELAGELSNEWTGLKVDVMAMSTEDVQTLVEDGLELRRMEIEAGIKPGGKYTAENRQALIDAKGRDFKNRYDAIIKNSEKIRNKKGDYSAAADKILGDVEAQSRMRETMIEKHGDKFRNASQRDQLIMAFDHIAEQHEVNTIDQMKKHEKISNDVEEVVFSEYDEETGKIKERLNKKQWLKKNNRTRISSDQKSMLDAEYKRRAPTASVQTEAIMTFKEQGVNAVKILEQITSGLPKGQRLETVEASDKKDVIKKIKDDKTIGLKTKNQLIKAVKESIIFNGAIVGNKFIVLDKKAADTRMKTGEGLAPFLQSVVMSHEISHWVDDAGMTEEEITKKAEDIHNTVEKNNTLKPISDYVLGYMRHMHNEDGSIFYDPKKSFKEQSNEFKDEYIREFQSQLQSWDFTDQYNKVKDIKLTKKNEALFDMIDYINNFKEGRLSERALARIRLAIETGKEVAAKTKKVKYSQIYQDVEQTYKDYKGLWANKESRESIAVMISDSLENEVKRRIPKDFVKGFTEEDIDEVVSQFISPTKAIEDNLSKSLANRGLVALVMKYDEKVNDSVMGYLNAKVRGRSILDVRLQEFIESHPKYGRIIKSETAEGVSLAIDKAAETELTPEELMIQKEEKKYNKTKEERELIIIHEAFTKRGIKDGKKIHNLILEKLNNPEFLKSKGIDFVVDEKTGQVKELVNVDFKTLKGLVLDEVQEMFGIVPKPGLLTKPDIRNAQQFIANNKGLLWNILPEGYNENQKSTGVTPVLMTERPTKKNKLKEPKDVFYTKKQVPKITKNEDGDIVHVEDKNARPINLEIQRKIQYPGDEEFLSVFGVTQRGDQNFYKKEDNTSSRIRAIVAETERMMINQAVRLENLDPIGTLMDGKSDIMYSRLVRGFTPAKTDIFYNGLRDLGTKLKGSNYDDIQSVKDAINYVYGDTFTKGVVTNLAKDIQKLLKRYSRIEQNAVDNKTIPIETLEDFLFNNVKAKAEDTNIIRLLKLGNINLSSQFDNIDKINTQRAEFVNFLNQLLKPKHEGGYGLSKAEVIGLIPYFKGMYASSVKIGRGIFTVKNGRVVEAKLKPGEELGDQRYQVFQDVKDFIENGVNQVDGLNVELTEAGNIKSKQTVDGETVSMILLSETSKAVLKDITKKGEGVVYNERKQQAKTSRKVIDLMMDHFVKQIENGNLDRIDLAMLMGSMKSNMQGPLKRAANLNYISTEKGLLASDYRYEHMIPTNYVLLNLVDIYMNNKGKNRTQKVKKLYSHYTVALISKKMDKIINKMGLESVMPVGYFIGDPSWKRYYNSLTYLDPNITTIRSINPKDKGKIIGEDYVKVSNILSKNIEKNRAASEATKKSRTVNDPNGISVFDFDETAGISDNYVIATKGGQTQKISSEQWPIVGEQLKKDGWKMDFSDFNKVTKGRPGPLMQKLKNQIERYGNKNVFILTARAAESAPAIKAYLESEGVNLPIENITGLGNSTGEAKAIWMLGKVAEGYNDFYFVDDATENVEAVKNVLEQVDVKHNVQQVKLQKHGKFLIDTSTKEGQELIKQIESTKTVSSSEIKKVGNWIIDTRTIEGFKFYNKFKNTKTVRSSEFKLSRSISMEFNEILEQSTGVEAGKIFSDAQAKLRGKRGRFKGIIPPSAQDFAGLLYNFLEKGEIGEKQMKFFKEVLIDPFARGINELNASKQSTANDYRNFLKEFPGIRKKLRKEVKDPTGRKTGFTADHAVRVYLWLKAGFNVPGLSNRDLNALDTYIKENPELQAFADGVGLISKKEDGYGKPGEYWLTENITSDLLSDGAIGDIRSDFLAEWKQNKEIIFSKENLNKIEAIYGSKFREALEDILYRMETGSNRPTGANRLTNMYMNWVNNSVGAIMFFNIRSAVLQTISATNYVNWQDNNIFKAAAAFANQKQFWKDFGMIFNSDMLKQRRAGNQRSVNESELANAVIGSSNPAKAAIAWLLTKGFLPTQIADSFAIASGGAAFYRNRVNTYLKSVNTETGKKYTQKEAEEKAWLDFQETTEVSQQSARPDLISQQQANPLGRLILSFQNTPMQYARIMNKAARDLAAGRGDAKTHVSKIVYYGVIQSIIFTGLQTALFAALGDEDEEEFDKKKDRMLNSIVDSWLVGIGYGGKAISTMKNTLMEYFEQREKGFTADHTYTIITALGFSPAIGSKLRKIYSAIQTERFNKDVMSERGFKLDNPAWSMIGNVIEGVTNIPLGRIAQKLNNLDNAMDSNNETWQRIALILGWNTWDLGVKDLDIKELKDEIRERQDIEKKQKTKETKQQKQRDKEAGERNLEKQFERDQSKERSKKKKDIKCVAVVDGRRCNITVEGRNKKCTIHEEVQMRSDKKEIRCKSKTSSGSRCKIITRAKSGLCYYHD